MFRAILKLFGAGRATQAHVGVALNCFLMFEGMHVPAYFLHSAQPLPERNPRHLDRARGTTRSVKVFTTTFEDLTGHDVDIVGSAPSRPDAASEDLGELCWHVNTHTGQSFRQGPGA